MKYKTSVSGEELSVSVLVSIRSEYEETELVTKLMNLITSALKEMQVNIHSEQVQSAHSIRLVLVEQGVETSFPRNKHQAHRMYHLDFDKK